MKKKDHKTSTFHFILAATKYNFHNLIDITKEVVLYYNTKKTHEHLNGLTPDTWAYQARLLPNKTHILTAKEVSANLNGSNPMVELLKRKMLFNILRL